MKNIYLIFSLVIIDSTLYPVKISTNIASEVDFRAKIERIKIRSF